jgi:hypothetical protein
MFTLIISASKFKDFPKVGQTCGGCIRIEGILLHPAPWGYARGAGEWGAGRYVAEGGQLPWFIEHSSMRAEKCCGHVWILTNRNPSRWRI